MFGYTVKHGMQWLAGEDQSFLGAVEVFSKGQIEKSLTAFSSSQTAKLLGNINTKILKG